MSWKIQIDHFWDLEVSTLGYLTLINFKISNHWNSIKISQIPINSNFLQINLKMIRFSPSCYFGYYRSCKAHTIWIHLIVYSLFKLQIDGKFHIIRKCVHKCMKTNQNCNFRLKCKISMRLTARKTSHHPFVSI